MNWLTQNWITLVGVIAGGLIGYVYWQQIGCVSGSCAISSKPINSTLYGSLLGYLMVGVFKKREKK